MEQQAEKRGRRRLLKAGVAVSAILGMEGAVRAKDGEPDDKTTQTVDSSRGLAPSPATTPFMEALPMPVIKTPVAALDPEWGELAGTDECGRDNHQRYVDFNVPTYVSKRYELFTREGLHSFHPQMPPTRIWGYDGIYPGPTFVARYGEPCVVRIHNQLPANHVGFGAPEITTHLHNLHCASESDGFTTNYYSPTRFGPTLTRAGRYLDHFYPNVYAGFDQYGGIGDPREALGTLWYHDHRIDFTAQNVYRGLAGFYLLFDHIDSGNERDPNPAALRLPSGVGVYDIPLVVQDKRFDAQGQLAFDLANTDGLLGDKYVVNGKIQPYFKVQRRKYRFRILNASVARVFDFAVQYKDTDNLFHYIANDGNLLERPLMMAKATVAPAERADIVIDFSRFNPGDQVFLVNKAHQINGRGPSGSVLKPAHQLLRFDVGGNPPQPDFSRVPSTLRALPPIDLSEVKQTRVFEFARNNGSWTVNGKLFDARQPIARPKRNTAEIWVLRGGGDWVHPVHIHFEEGRILTRNGQLPPPHERGRKDVYLLHKGEEIRIFIRFRDFTGKYMMHCHNLIHEDHAMMLRFDIEN